MSELGWLMLDDEAVFDRIKAALLPEHHGDLYHIARVCLQLVKERDDAADALAQWEARWAALLGLARQAINGWAVFARRNVEHDEIARLHAVLAEMQRVRAADRDICYCRKNPCECFRHDEQCESELTSHGYTPCRCGERLAAEQETR